MRNPPYIVAMLFAIASAPFLGIAMATLQILLSGFYLIATPCQWIAYVHRRWHGKEIV